MRLAYVYDAVHPWETGGVQKRVWELSRRLARDHDVHWYGMRFWDGQPVLEREGVTLHGVTRPRSLYVDGRRSIPEAIRFAFHLVRPLLRAEFEVIDCQSFPYFPGAPSKLSALVNGSSMVMTWHEVWTEYWYEYLGWKGAAGRAVERLVAELPNEHLAVSSATQRDLTKLGVTDSHRVPNGISMAEVDGAAAADDPVDVLFVGRLIKEKNTQLLVRAIDELRSTRPDITCRIVGEGPEQARIDQLIEERGLESNILRTDFLESHAEILGMMKAASVLALPSRREGFGITALEALACGTPVVTIAHPQNAVTELVDDGGTGFICEATPWAVAEGIKRATRDISRTACVEAAKDYDWDRIADRVESFYLGLV